MAGLAAFVAASILCGAGAIAGGARFRQIVAGDWRGACGARFAFGLAAHVSRPRAARSGNRDLGRRRLLAVFAAGPLISGFIVDGLGWRSIFWINVPLGGIAMTLAIVSVPAERGGTMARMNFLGV